MKILVIEDEIMVARCIMMFCQNILGQQVTTLEHFMTIEDAQDFIAKPFKQKRLQQALENLHHKGFSRLRS